MTRKRDCRTMTGCTGDWCMHVHRVQLVCAGHAPDMCRACAGYAPGTSRVCTGYAPGMRWVCAGNAGYATGTPSIRRACAGLAGCVEYAGMHRVRLICAGHAPVRRERRVCTGYAKYTPSMRWVGRMCRVCRYAPGTPRMRWVCTGHAGYAPDTPGTPGMRWGGTRWKQKKVWSLFCSLAAAPASGAAP